MNSRWAGCILAAFQVLCAPPLSFATVRISEIMASNSATYSDESGEYDDWAELHNSGSEPVNVGGFFLSDDPANPLLWRVPDSSPATTTIPSGGFLVIWFDGSPEEGVLHVDTRLAKGGGSVLLVGADGRTVVDRVDYPPLERDAAFGLPSGGREGCLLGEPTPGRENGRCLSSGSEITFSLPAGIYGEAQRLELESPGNEIVYTLYTPDPEKPTDHSALKVVESPYTGPLTLSTTSVVRARAVDRDGRETAAATRTFIIGEPYALPVVSLVTDPDNLFHQRDGIYMPGPEVGPEDRFPFWEANWFMGHRRYYRGTRRIRSWRDYEIPVHAEYFTRRGEVGFSLEAGLEIAGGFSRGHPKKSFNIKTRKAYGPGKIRYRLFDDNPYDVYDGLNLRAGTQNRSRVKNEIVYMAHREFGLHVDMQAYRPVVLLIDGMYWGIYTAMERKGRDMLASRYGYGDIEVFRGMWEGRGSHDAIDEFRRLLSKYDVQDKRVYSRIQRYVDLDSFLDNWMLNVYFGRKDISNAMYWHRRAAGSKVRWIAFDFDSWSGWAFPTLRNLESDSTSSRWMLFSLLQNETFRNRFVNRIADFLNTVGSPESMTAYLEKAAAAIEGEIRRESERWAEVWIEGKKKRFTYRHYEEEIAEIRDFLSRRPGYLRTHLDEYFNFGGTAEVTLDVPGGGGTLRINTIEVDSFPWTGAYYRGVPVTVTAVPDSNHAFAGWEGEALPPEGTVTLPLPGDVAIAARFEPSRHPVVITEISHRPAREFNAGEWIELHNRSNRPIDLSGWRLLDGRGDRPFDLPGGTVLGPGDYVVLAGNRPAFETLFPEVSAVSGSFDFRLGKRGEHLRLFDAEGRLMDEVDFTASPPWPEGEGNAAGTLELLDAEADNNLGESWRVSAPPGTPGAPPSVSMLREPGRR